MLCVYVWRSFLINLYCVYSETLNSSMEQRCYVRVHVLVKTCMCSHVHVLGCYGLCISYTGVHVYISCKVYPCTFKGARLIRDVYCSGFPLQMTQYFSLGWAKLHIHVCCGCGHLIFWLCLYFLFLWVSTESFFNGSHFKVEYVLRGKSILEYFAYWLRCDWVSKAHYLSVHALSLCLCYH